MKVHLITLYIAVIALVVWSTALTVSVKRMGTGQSTVVSEQQSQSPAPPRRNTQGIQAQQIAFTGTIVSIEGSSFVLDPIELESNLTIAIDSETTIAKPGKLSEEEFQVAKDQYDAELLASQNPSVDGPPPLPPLVEPSEYKSIPASLSDLQVGQSIVVTGSEIGWHLADQAIATGIEIQL